MLQEVALPFDVELPPVKILTAGVLTCMYETGKLRYVRYGNTELVRMVYGAVRNELWQTIPCELQDEEVIINDLHFSIRFSALYRQQDLLYKASFHIEGRSDNTIVFSMKGEALTAFQKNRIGICVHHPIKECRGKPVVITRPDGTDYHSSFPDLVSPQQPFLQVKQMQWETAPDTTIRVLFEGDVFETEDQRNWSDSSFKTYSTPLDLPFPVNVHPGDTIEQKVIIKFSGNSPGNELATPDEIREEKIRFPQIGYSRSDNQPPLTVAEISWLKNIPFDHYRVSISMSRQDWPQQLQSAFKEALQINTLLELVVFFSDAFAEELRSLLLQLKEHPNLIRSLLLLHKNQKVSPAELLHYAYPVIRKVLPRIKIGYGTDFFFADLNRNRPGHLPCDFISFSLHPQVHAFDNRSLLENLENQPDMVETAISFAAGKEICISPITLKDRYYFIGADKRQNTWFMALWTLFTLQQLSAAFSITCFELFGASGILQINADGGDIIKPSPIYETLTIIHKFQPLWIIKRYSGENLLMNGVMLEDEYGKRLFFKSPVESLSYKDSGG